MPTNDDRTALDEELDALRAMPRSAVQQASQQLLASASVIGRAGDTLMARGLLLAGRVLHVIAHESRSSVDEPSCEACGLRKTEVAPDQWECERCRGGWR
jgi:hypothetical protein